jgi:CspA family cold shock protein
MTVRVYGMVRAYDSFKGFGFIRRDKGKDVFFFYDDIEHDDKVISLGDTVSFTLESAPKGPKAKELRKEGQIT